MFRELIYAGRDVEQLCKTQYPNCIIRDASDCVHRERFEIETEVKKADFYLFALREGFINCCFTFLLANLSGEKPVGEWAEVFAALKAEIAKRKAKGE
jgi:hypothetical protein